MHGLKFKYRIILLIHVLACIVISGYPVWAISVELADFLSVIEELPVKQQENGWLWFILFLSEAITILLFIYWLTSLLFSKSVGWSRGKYINVFWKTRFPLHWYCE